MSPQKITKEDFRSLKLSFEYVLPDYEPTFKRVMLSDARLVPNEKIVLTDSVTLSGAVEYHMVYQSVDDELSSLCFSVPYECSLVCEQGAEHLIDHVLLASFSCMPSGPRRVSARAEVCASLQSITNEFPSVLDAQADLHVLRASFPYTSYKYATDQQREYAETVLELAGSDAVVLYSEGAVCIDEMRPMKDGIFVGGRCVICALISEAGIPRQIRGEIPFEEFLPMGSMLSEEARIRATGEMRSLSLSVQNEQDASSLVANAVVSFDATVAEREMLSVPLDAYSTENEVYPKYEPYTLSSEAVGASFKERVEMHIPSAGADPAPMTSILYIAPRAQILECKPTENALELTLKMSASMIGTSECPDASECARDEEADVTPTRTDFVRHKGEETFVLSLPLVGATPQMRATVASPTILGVSAVFEEDGFTVCVDVGICASLCEERTVMLCTDVERGAGACSKPKDSVCIVFPDSTDTLWSLAKENHTAITEILRENPEIRCDEDSYNSPKSLEGLRHILIP